jgi:tetratricopeptide (TPR) repeat protein
VGRPRLAVSPLGTFYRRILHLRSGGLSPGPKSFKGMTQESQNSSLTLKAVAIVALALLVLGWVLTSLSLNGKSDLERGLRLEAEGRFGEAAQIYGAVLAEDPTSLQAVKGLAVALAVTGRFDEALPYQERACDADASDAQTRVELALNYMNHQGRPAEAVATIREAVALEPTPRNRALMGQLLIADGQAGVGREVLEDLIAQEPGYAYGYQVLVRHLERVGRHEEAATVRSTALKRGIVLRELESIGGGA